MFNFGNNETSIRQQRKDFTDNLFAEMVNHVATELHNGNTTREVGAYALGSIVCGNNPSVKSEVVRDQVNDAIDAALSTIADSETKSKKA